MNNAFGFRSFEFTELQLAQLCSLYFSNRKNKAATVRSSELIWPGERDFQQAVFVVEWLERFDRELEKDGGNDLTSEQLAHVFCTPNPDWVSIRPL